MYIAYEDIPKNIVTTFIQRVQNEHPLLYKAHPALTLSFLNSPTFRNELMQYGLLSAFFSLELTLEENEPEQSICKKLYLYRYSLSQLEALEDRYPPLLAGTLSDDIFTVWELLLNTKEAQQLLSNLLKNYSRPDANIILEKIAMIVVQESVLSKLNVIEFIKEQSLEEILETILQRIQEAIWAFFE